MSDELDGELELTAPLVPLFVIAQGRALPRESEYEHTTIITAQDGAVAAARTLAPEARTALLRDLVTGFLTPPAAPPAGSSATSAPSGDAPSSTVVTPRTASSVNGATPA